MSIDLFFTKARDSLIHKLNPLVNEDEKLKHQLNEKIGETVKKFIQHVEKYRDRKIKLSADERQEKIYQSDVWLGQKIVEFG
jgi:hypothetical protein